MTLLDLNMYVLRGHSIFPVYVCRDASNGEGLILSHIHLLLAIAAPLWLYSSLRRRVADFGGHQHHPDVDATSCIPFVTHAETNTFYWLISRCTTVFGIQSDNQKSCVHEDGYNFECFQQRMTHLIPHVGWITVGIGDAMVRRLRCIQMRVCKRVCDSIRSCTEVESKVIPFSLFFYLGRPRLSGQVLARLNGLALNAR
jgi:hypothetical protein